MTYRFPQDDRRKIWIHRCKRLDKFSSDKSYICSAHFKEDDFEIDMRTKIMGLPEKRILKNTAIPELNIPGFGTKRLSSDLDENNMKLSRSDRMKRRREEQVLLYEYINVF